MPARVRWFTDPACAASWAAEPVVRRLMVEFGGELSFTYVMGGLAREISEPPWEAWARAAASGMPVDALLWGEGPIASTYPACMAVKAASEQASDGGYRYLRILREGLFCHRRKLDSTEALVEEARRAGLDVERFRIDLGSHATVEAYGFDLELRRAHEAELPFAVYGDDAHVAGLASYEDHREAAVRVGATPAADRPGVAEALERFGAMAQVEVEAVTGLPAPRAGAELWALAAEWKVKPERVGAGWLFESSS